MKTLENTKIKELPTSQLVFYMTSINDESIKSNIETTLYRRLTKSYKLQPDAAKRFVTREEGIIENRGSNIENYCFGKDMSYDEFLKIFYESVTIISKVINTQINFNTLTMSEIVYFHKKFFGILKILSRRSKKYYLRNKEYSKVLDKVDSETYEDKSDELFKKMALGIKLMTREGSLYDYFSLLRDSMKEKLCDMLEYDNVSLRRQLLSLFKEELLLMDSLTISSQEEEQYEDLNFDIYTYFTEMASQYNVQGFQFSKQKIL